MLTLAAILLWPRKPAPPTHPLAIATTANIQSISLDGERLAPTSAAYRAAAALPPLIARLKPTRTDRRWIDMRVLRYSLRDGSTLWLQAMPDPAGAWLRVTSDAPKGRTTHAAAIRALRLNGYHVPAAAIAPLLPWESMGDDGAARSPTGLSTRTKPD